MDRGKKLAENVEWQFANHFNDFKDMSTMVGLTAGVSCNDVGITKSDCHKEIQESVKS